MNSNLSATPAKGAFNLTPQSLDEALRFADLISKASIVPKDYQNNPGNVIIAIQWGAEIGLPPLQAMQNIAVINGRPSIWGDAMLALVRGSGLLESIREDVTDTGATCTIKRKGEAETTRTFTMEDATKAGLKGKQGPWSQYPKRMLQMRARAFALRDVFPDVLRGVHVAEESMDTPREIDITNESRVIPPAMPSTAPTPPNYPVEKFTNNLPAWREAIASGKKTPEAIITMASTKGTLTDEQKAAIRAPIEPPPAVDNDFVGAMEQEGNNNERA